jgi:hypothetical protein
MKGEAPFAAIVLRERREDDGARRIEPEVVDEKERFE